MVLAPSPILVRGGLSSPRRSSRLQVSNSRRSLKVPGWTSSYNRTDSETALAVVPHDVYTVVSAPGMEVFSTPELLRLILLVCDWPTVMAVSRACRYARHTARSACQSSFQDILLPFISEGDFLDFVGMLDATGSGVIGSVARRLLYGNSNLHTQAIVEDDAKYLRSRDLNIVVPSGNLQEVKDWFLEKGVKEFKREGTQLPFSSVVRAMYHGIRPAAGGQPAARITISHSEGNIMQVVLASPFSAQANLVTSTRVYCVYPHLATDRMALRCNAPSVKGIIRSIPSSFESKRDNAMWKENGACLKYCPALYRTSVGDKITASFLWNIRYDLPISRFEHTDSLLASSVLSWRLAAKCRNVRCKHYTPA